MNYTKIFITLLITMNSGIVSPQDIKSHEWKNRLILILIDKIDNEDYHKQLEELENHLNGVKERKILVCHISPLKYKVGLPGNEWQKSETVYSRYKKTESQPEIILIGLDGGIKLRTNKFLSCQKLFATIDAMPMRKQEMERKKK